MHRFCCRTKCLDFGQFVRASMYDLIMTLEYMSLYTK